MSRLQVPSGGAGPAAGREVRRDGRMRRVLLVVFVAGLLALGGTAAYYAYAATHWVATADAHVTGTVVYVYPTAAGRLESWNVRLDQRVAAGDVLGEIDPSGTGAAVRAGVPIVSQASGTIVENQAVVGQQVLPDLGIPLTALVDLRRLWIQADVPETRVGRLRVGLPVSVTVDAFPGRVFAGRVAAIEHTTQAADVQAVLPPTYPVTFQKEVQRVPVRIDLDRIPAGMYPGMDAEVRIQLG